MKVDANRRPVKKERIRLLVGSQCGLSVADALSKNTDLGARVLTVRSFLELTGTLASSATFNRPCIGDFRSFYSWLNFLGANFT